MKALPNKSNLRFIAHNPTSHLIMAFQKRCIRIKKKRKNL